MNQKLTKEDCLGVAARIWCDWQYSHIVMDIKICEQIAEMLYKVVLEQEKQEISAN